MRVVIIGPGAIGLLFAFRLAAGGVAVTLLDHRPGRAERLNQAGVELEDAGGSQRQPVAATADPRVLAEADLALVCVKAYHTPQVARTLAAHLGPKARALTLQNGAGNLETLVEALGPQRVMGGITSEGANVLGEGRVRHAGQGTTYLGRAQGPPDAFVEQAVALFKQAGFQSEAAPKASDVVWTKLVVNVGLNALAALLEVPNGRLLELEHASSLMGEAVAEAVAVGRAEGVRFLHEDMLSMVQDVTRATGANINSMLQDVRKRRRTEVAQINGFINRRGQELEVPTPVNATLEALVLAKEENYR